MFHIIDNFYADPALVRAYALRQNFLSVEEFGVNFSGHESVNPFFTEKIIQKIEARIQKKIKVKTNENSFGKFRISNIGQSRKTLVHIDNTDWTAIIHLSKNEGKDSGTAFYKHIETGFSKKPSLEELRVLGYSSWREFDSSVILKDSMQLNKWEEINFVPMKFNRCVLINGAEYFHAIKGFFGHDFESGRLTQNFFFNEVV